MSDTKISGLSALTGATVAVSTDLLAIVDTSATATKKITVEELRIAIGLAQNSQSAAYTTVMADAGGQILHPSTDNAGRVFTVDSNANVAYPIGTTLTFVNQISTVTISTVSDTMVMAGTGTTGNRTLAANGIATALKIFTTTWIISGTNLS